MTKQTMLKYYRKHSAADSYIIGFSLDKMIYFVEIDEIMPRFLKVGQASRNRGEVLRLRMTKAQKESLMKKNPICLGSAELLENDYYNRGEIFEKLITEYYGQTWEKDNIPFWEQGDININGKEVQIKFNEASLINEGQIKKLKKIT